MLISYVQSSNINCRLPWLVKTEPAQNDPHRVSYRLKYNKNMLI